MKQSCIKRPQKTFLSRYLPDFIQVFGAVRKQLCFFKDDSDYLAFKEITCLPLNFLVRACTAVFSAHSNLLYYDEKYANGTTICTSYPLSLHVVF